MKKSLLRFALLGTSASLVTVFAVTGLALNIGWRQARSKDTVGMTGDNAAIVATGQRVQPAGDILTYGGRPVDMALSPQGESVYIKDDKGVTVAQTMSWKVRQRLSFPEDGGGSLHGIRVSKDGKRVWASGAGKTVWEMNVGEDGALTNARGIALPGPGGKGASYPCGIAANADESRLYVCLSRNNTLAEIEIASGKIIREIPVGVAPYAVTLSPKGDIAYVSVWGGRPPVKGEREADSSGTPTRVDERGVALRGGVSFIDLTVGKSIALTETGRHAGALALSLDGKSLYVANANDDTVSIVNAASHRILKTFTVRQDTVLPYGSQPNALALSTDGAMLYIACGGNNAVASLNLVAGKIQGWIPAGWYPGALLIKEGTLYIASTKGFGSRGEPANKDTKGMNVYQYLGVLQRMNTPSDREYATLTAQALADSRMVDAQRDREKRRLDAVHVPVPERVGEPSSIKRIVYIIKENRTYDQVFGDLKQGDGDPSLCLYGRKITPNHHALAEQFVLLDNFYCNGVLSADGHSWATEGNNTDHLEKAFGGFTRSYTFGDDALTYSSTGFLWDKILDKGLSFRNYGEMDYTDEKPDVSYAAILKDWQDKTGKITFTHKIGIERLKKHSSPDAPGWNMDIPDVVRADVFLRDLKKWEKSGELPNLTILYLPNDHTTGTTPGDPTPQAYLADNDLALGRVVEGVTRSRFWKDTCIFVVEDDPQAGFDHVDGHRSLCLVISPYTRRGVVISDFYNQTSVLHTIGRILGVSAMNQQDAAAPLMTSCFQKTPDLTPFVALPNTVPLGQPNPKQNALAPLARSFAFRSAAMDFSGPDRADEDHLNRILWADAKGGSAYPKNLAGAHGSGLARRGLRIDSNGDD